MPIALGCAIAALAPSRSLRAAPLFAAPYISFQVGSAPSSLASGDLNRDGWPDLVVANSGSNSISVLLGDGGGMFEPSRDFPAAPSPRFVALADVNGDGRLDAIVEGAGAAPGLVGTTTVALGVGDGTFQAPIELAISPAAMACADVNRDGKADLIVTSTTATVSVMLSLGDGTFGSPVEFGVNGGGNSIAVGDLNDDGSPDLVVTNDITDTFSVLLGGLSGAFQESAIYAVSGAPKTVALGDLTGDRLLDVSVMMQASGERTMVGFGRGDGSFTPLKEIGLDGQISVAVAISDLNRDGMGEVLVTNGSYLRVWVASHGGSFGDGIIYSAGLRPIGIAVADFNRDGWPDLAVANPNASTCTVTFGNGDGSFGSIQAYTDFNYYGPSGCIAADLNSDGRLDIAYGLFSGGGTVVMLGDGTGGIVDSKSWSNGYSSYSIAVGDLDRDGTLDLVTTLFANGAGGSSIAVLPGVGDGSFGAARQYPAANGARGLVLADFNGDGILDVAATCHSAAGAPTDVVSIFLGVGDGTLGPRSDLPVVGFPYGIAAGDFNGDGRFDLVVASENSTFLSVLLGNGDGTFRPAASYPAGNNPKGVSTGDLNGDGRTDVAVTFDGTSTVGVLLGNGDGTLGPVHDFGADALPSHPSNVPENRAAGTLQADGLPTAGNNSSFLAVGDLNGDGIPDLAAASGESTVEVLIGNGDGTFGQRIGYGTWEPYSVAMGDLNGDGQPDLIVTGNGGVRVLLNVGVSTPTATDLSLIDSHVEPSRVDLSWYGATLAGRGATVYRQSPGASWTRVGTIAADGTGKFLFSDTNVRPGARYGYRLGISSGGAEEFLGETWITVPNAWALSLAAPVPNPVTTHLSLAISLPNASPARLEVVDIAGRIVATKDAGALGAGQHVVTFGEARGWAPGIYLIRLTQGEHSAMARACIVR